MDDSLLFRAIKGQTNPSEQLAVEAWRRASSQHEVRYQELKGVLAATTRPDRVASDPPPVLEVLEIAARRERMTRRATWTRRVAAVAGVAAVVVAAVTMQRQFAGSPPGDFGFEEMVTGDNQTVTVALRDGSVMRLAPRSHARIRVQEGLREVHLTGRAFFSVAKRNGLPFRVKTRGGEVTVLGTQFDLDAENEDVRLVVVEGKVALAAARGGEAQLVRGEEARVVEGQLLPTVQLPEAREVTRWVGRFLAFQGTPLSEVAHEIEQAYGAKVTIVDTTLSQQTVTNWFSDRPLDEVVRVVCAVVATECEVQGNAVTMGKPR
ncbi:MAG TPA: FecR domain-containing protein [Gemmatimonadaceae bacterium]|mgnify:FL=1|nr:FecR domain-containing protein [Gemmatimonadaceae bacterium]